MIPKEIITKIRGKLAALEIQSNHQWSGDKIIDEIRGFLSHLSELSEKCGQVEPVSEELEEKAKHYGSVKHPMSKIGAKESQEDFIAGAKWQKEMMMKEAVEADVMLTLHDKTGDISLHTGYLPKELGIKCNDKVRIIIVKED